MEGLTDVLQFRVRCGGELLTCRFDLAWDDQWVEGVRSPKDSVGPTSMLLWLASRKLAKDPPIWEVEYEISAARVVLDEEIPPTTFGIDGIEIVPPENAPHAEWANPRSVRNQLATTFVLLPRRAICGRLALGVTSEAPTLEEIALGMPSVSPTALSRFGPGEWPLPIYDQSKQNAKWVGKRRALQAALAAGVTFAGEDWTDGIHDAALKCGWLRPYLPLDLLDCRPSYLRGWQGLQHGRYALLAMTLVAQRCRFAYLRAERDQGVDGRPLSVDDIAGESPEYDPISSAVELPWFRAGRVIGNPDTKVLLATDRFDQPHPGLWTVRDAHAHEAWEFFQTPLCARLIWASAEEARLYWSERGVAVKDRRTREPAVNLLTLLKFARRDPSASCSSAGYAHGACVSAAMMFKVRGVLVSDGWKAWARDMLELLRITAHDYDFDVKTDLDRFEDEHTQTAWGAYCLSRQFGYSTGDWPERGFETLRRSWRQGNYAALGCALAAILSKDYFWFQTLVGEAASPKAWTQDVIYELAQADDGLAQNDVAMAVAGYQRAERDGKV